MDAAAKQFSTALDSGLIPMEFVNDMRKKGTLIMGIGHRIKSVSFLESKRNAVTKCIVLIHLK